MTVQLTYDCCPYTCSNKLENTSFSAMNSSCSIPDFLLIKLDKMDINVGIADQS